MDLDEADKVFVDSLIPDGAIPVALVAVVAWVNGDGGMQWRCYVDADAPVSSVVGLCEFAKLHVIARSDTGLPFAYPDDD